MLPEGEVQRRGEGDPCKVRRQDQACSRLDAPGSYERACDEKPEQQDLSKRDTAEMPREEQPTPQRVGDELDDEKAERK